jgi:hypothetical protein
MIKRVFLPVGMGLALLTPKMSAQDLMAPDPAEDSTIVVEETPQMTEPVAPEIGDLPADPEVAADPDTLIDPFPDLPGGRLEVPDVAAEEEQKEKDPGFSWRDHMKFRQIRTKIEADPKLQELRQAAAEAPYDSLKRQHLKEYYTRLFEGARKADPSLEPLIARVEADTFARITQDRIDPSYPPGQAPAPASSPAPAEQR